MGLIVLRCPGNSEKAVYSLLLYLPQYEEKENITLNIQVFMYKSLSNHCHTPMYEMMRGLVWCTWRQ